MENEEVKVVDQTKSEEKPVEKKDEATATVALKKRGPKPKKENVKKDETIAKATSKKRGPKPKKDSVKTTDQDAAEKKDPAKRGTKKTVKEPKVTAAEPKTSAKIAAAKKFNFAKTVFEFENKQYTEDTINSKVLDYLVKHPYIHADKIETFVNVEEKRVYFTVDGFGNNDFTIDL
ncbi:DUF6465 family protein [Oribacterium sp. WCC10]|uniref:DUF6465 family protein n=1 Tax=Oribacterium sp. WCC10 TaxID=1855343 RepID=UPI0008F1C53A|nr:DUF6465 family protein [Oribacterium sp. WCC10]SFG67219.1 hypothetical protein SAMN05216356_11833 [Oribacterium sp. WCC10]